MMELRPPNVSTAQYGGFGVQNGSVPSLESTLQPLPLDPWDVALCISGTIISCENAALLAVLVVLVVTPAFRVPVFLLVGSLAAADLLVGLRLILRFASISLVPSEALALGTAGLLLTAFTASVCSVLAIAAERFVSLQHALTYSSGRAAGPGSRCCSPVEYRCAAGRCPPCAGTACGIRPPVAPSGRSAGPTSPPSPSPSWPPSPCCCSSARRSAASPGGTRSTWPRRGSSQGGRRHGAHRDGRAGAHAGRLRRVLAALRRALPTSCCRLRPQPLIYAFRNGELWKVLWALCCGCRSAAVPLRSRSSPRDVGLPVVTSGCQAVLCIWHPLMCCWHLVTSGCHW